MWNHFANENLNTVLEICSLNELHYPLARTQGELTTVQKLFLFKAYPLFREMTEPDSQGNTKSQRDVQAELDWNKRTRQRIQKKRRERARRGQKS